MSKKPSHLATTNRRKNEFKNKNLRLVIFATGNIGIHTLGDRKT
jgi:hypothetical protein